MSFRLWLKGRKTAPRKTKNPGEFTYPSMNIGRERAFYMGLTFCIIMIIGLAFLLYPLYAYTPVGLRPTSIMDAEGLVMFPKDSAWGYFFGSDLLSITLDITDTPSISELPLDITNYSDNYKTLTYEVLTEEFGMGPYKARALSYFAWTIGEGQEVAWGAWQGIAVPVGLTIGDFLSSVFGPTWDILAASTITAPWKQYFLSIMFTTTGFAIMFAIWIDPVRRRGMSKIHKKISGIKQRFTYGMNDKFNIKVRKSQPWTTIAVILMALTYYLAFYKKYFMGTNNLIFEGLQSIFWISAIASVIIFYQTFIASKHLGNKPGKRGPKAKRDKQMEKDSTELQEIRADRDIFRSEARRGMFSGWNLSKFMGNNYDGNKDANELAGRMLREKSPEKDPYGNPVYRQQIVTPSGRVKEGVISTTVTFGEGKDQVKEKFSFNTEEDKEAFRETVKQVKKQIKNKEKNKEAFDRTYGGVINTLKEMGTKKEDIPIALERVVTIDMFNKINRDKQIAMSKGYSPDEAAALAIRRNLDPNFGKGLEEYTQTDKRLKEDIDSLKTKKKTLAEEQKELKKKREEDIKRMNQQREFVDTTPHVTGMRGSLTGGFRNLFMTTPKGTGQPDPDNPDVVTPWAYDISVQGVPKGNILYIANSREGARGIEHDKIVLPNRTLKRLENTLKVLEGKKNFDIVETDMGTMASILNQGIRKGFVAQGGLNDVEQRTLYNIFSTVGSKKLAFTNVDNKGRVNKEYAQGVIRITARPKKYQKAKKSNYSISKPKQKKKRRWI